MSKTTSTSGTPLNATRLTSQEKAGVLAGLGCYVFWGLCPLYWKLLDEVNPFEIIAHRIIWCFALTAMVCAVFKLGLPSLLCDKRARRYLAPAAVIITVNWSTYIYAIDIGHVIETSIGYYINPLMTILFGIIVFHEKLSRAKLAALLLCAAGVAYFTLSYGQFPWISIVLALTFAVYGVIKKKAGYPAVTALAFENTVMVVPAIAFAVGLAVYTGEHAFCSNLDVAHGWLITLLLVGSGLVTGLPLILFAKAANSIPLTLLGFIQYVSPTITLLLGVFAFGEPFTLPHAVCFGFIWAGLAIVSVEAIKLQRS
ncbi:MAG: EamA family transporter RarD [Eggerthellaceae bacterium]|nr:EamA family transporter RarD [Eggerthellaceae bacterium]